MIDDLADFFDCDEFAVQVTLLFANGKRRTVNAIFDDPYFNTDIGEYVLDTTEPRITAASKDIADLHWRADLVQIKGETFNVVTEPQHDGTGVAVVKLARQVNM